MDQVPAFEHPDVLTYGVKGETEVLHDFGPRDANAGRLREQIDIDRCGANADLAERFEQ